MEQEDEELLFELVDVEMSYGSSTGPSERRGLLQITSKRLRWKARREEGEGTNLTVDTDLGEQLYEAEIPCITLHAISKDPSSFPKPCLYCQISEGGEDEDEDASKEVYFVPEDPESLGPLFEALSRAALMNPDPPEAGENEGDDELIFDQTSIDGASGASEEQGRMLAHLEGLLTFSPNLVAASGQFDDVDEAEGAASGGGDQGQDEGRGEGGMNGHGADTTQ